MVGRTGCGKTSFVQHLAVNNIFGKLEKAEWVSQIALSERKEAQIQSCFSSQVEFHYPSTVNDLEDLIDQFKKSREKTVDDTDSFLDDENLFGQNEKLDKLTVMGDVSRLADKSNDFASFLTASRNFKYSCVYIFHVIYPEKSIWKLILLQMKILNIFPASVEQSNILKILSAKCIREAVFYLLQNSLWINRLFVNFANKNKKIYHTIDCRGINPNGPGRFRTEADNAEEQTRHFNISKNDKLFNTFLSKRIRNSILKETDIYFQIGRVESRSKNNENFDASIELKDLIENDTSVAREYRSQKSTSSGRKEIDKRSKKISSTKISFCALKSVKQKKNKKKKKR